MLLVVLLACVYIFIFICNTLSLLAANLGIYVTLMANNEIKNIISTPHLLNFEHSDLPIDLGLK